MRKIVNSNGIIAVLTFVYVVSFIYFMWKPFDKENIQVNCANEIEISHEWGNIHFTQYFQFKNIGQKQGAVTNIEGIIIGEKDDNPSFEKRINAQRVYSDNPFLNITLNSNDIFEGTITLFKEITTETKGLIAKYENLKFHQLDYMVSRIEPSKYIWKRPYMHPDTFNVMKSFILNNGLNELKKGTYYYAIRINKITKNNKQDLFFTRCFSFTLYESDINTLKSTVDEYQYGESIFYFSRPLKKTYIKIKLTEIPKTDEKYSMIISRFGNE